jgi:hypothetical protein
MKAQHFRADIVLERSEQRQNVCFYFADLLYHRYEWRRNRVLYFLQHLIEISVVYSLAMCLILESSNPVVGVQLKLFVKTTIVHVCTQSDEVMLFESAHLRMFCGLLLPQLRCFRS